MQLLNTCDRVSAPVGSSGGHADDAAEMDESLFFVEKLG